MSFGDGEGEGEKVFWGGTQKIMRLRYLIGELRRRSVELGMMGFPYLAFAFEAWDRLKRWVKRRGGA
jgi:hypothetical protein